MKRRDILYAAGFAAAAVPFAGLAPLLAQPASTLQEAARRAWIYGLPLIEMANNRREVLGLERPTNQLIHMSALTTPQTQFVTTPNNDTLYSRAWVNLSEGPVEITIPPTGERYASVALMDMYTNNFAVLGTRTTGGDGDRFTLIGPNEASNDPMAIRSPTPWVWLLVRVLVDGPADLKAARTLQQQFEVAGANAAGPSRDYATRSAEWNRYFESMQALMVENPPPATDDRVLDAFEPLGITPQGGFDPSRFDAAQVREIEAGVAAAKRELAGSRRQGRLVDSWAYPKSNLGDYGEDYFYRAQVSVGGLGALPNAEAMYMRPINANGLMPFDSDTDWVLHLPADRLPPVDSFWSLSMYQATDDGQFRFFDNAIDRYAIGDRTPGLRRNRDGSVDIWMTRTVPGPQRRSNWLPLPQEGDFGVVFRAYLPKSDLLDGVYALPPLQPIR